MHPAALEWVARFRRYLNFERRLSAHTDLSYARDLAALVKFCDRAGLADWHALDSQHIRLFAARSHAAGLAPRSIQRNAIRLSDGYENKHEQNNTRNESVCHWQWSPFFMDEECGSS